VAGGADGGTFDVHDPATGEALATLASATSEDAIAAFDAADAAAPFGGIPPVFRTVCPA
jgi:succinate-semialdehyde dehydrogenase/glutarate-semialdehyde dehydrogenase